MPRHTLRTRVPVSTAPTFSIDPSHICKFIGAKHR
jgi:hypothetical protein